MKSRAYFERQTAINIFENKNRFKKNKWLLKLSIHLIKIYIVFGVTKMSVKNKVHIFWR